MTPEAIISNISTVLALLECVLIVYQWKEKNRIRAKEEIWNKDTQSIVNIAANMEKRIDNNEIQDVKEARDVFMSIGAYANGIHVSMKEELKIKD